MGVGEKFRNFYDSIIMSSDDISSISYRYRRVTKVLNKYYYSSDSETNHCLYVGSYGRDTEVYTSDIDMLFELPYWVYEKYNRYSLNGQSALLQEVKNVISKTYSSSRIKADGQIISIKFSDGSEIELLPAFLNTDSYSYTYADTNGGGIWKTTNPKSEQFYINKLNNETNKNLKKICRLFRVWKEVNNVDIPGILIDIFAYNFLQNYVYKDKSFLYYDFLTRDFLKYLSEQPTSQTKWQTMGSGRFIFHYSNFQNKAKKSYEDTLKAIDYEDRKFDYSANLEWRKIYGCRF